MSAPHYDFYARIARVLNSGQSRSLILSGDVYDLFHDGSQYVPLIPYLVGKTQIDGLIRLVYELNGPIRVLEERDKLQRAWIEWRSGQDPDALLVQGLRAKGESEYDHLARKFDQLLIDAIGNPTLALEFLRQLTICSRSSSLKHDLLILVEAADMLLPSGREDVASLSDAQLRRIAIVQDWFGDPAFMTGGDSVCLIAESRALIHPRVSRMPQVLTVEIPAPSTDERHHFIETFCEAAPRKPRLGSSPAELAAATAGLSIHALRQLLAGAAYAGEPLAPREVVARVEQFIQAQLGDDVVEFKKPEHRLDSVVGFAKLKAFLREELIPRFRETGDAALPGAAVAGPIGSGKTFIFEAMAAELGVPVLVLKGIRSQWYGQTDVIFERLRRVLEALEKVVIFVDEADTQFGGVGREEHSTERRLTGKIQAMMSDPRLRGRVTWLLMTARIHLLSPDIRRPGRVGDLIIPVLDPAGDDRTEFLRWVAQVVAPEPDEATIARLDELTQEYSAAAFAALRSRLKAAKVKSLDEVVAIVRDQIPPAIGRTRRYQTLQALVNCTRRSLLPDPHVPEEQREAWEEEIRLLEAAGVA